MFSTFKALLAPLPIATYIAAFLLSSCTDSGNIVSEKEVKNAAELVAKYPFGGKVDSLNGISGHSFGDPLSSFPQMEATPPNPLVLTRVYDAVPEKEKGWFAKHSREVPSQYYYFLDDKFSGFRAIGDAPTLRAEVAYLLGLGMVQGRTTFWEGERARAVYTEKEVGFGQQGQLDIISKPLEAEQAQKEKARLKAENEQ